MKLQVYQVAGVGSFTTAKTAFNGRPARMFASAHIAISQLL
jgi:hypothetical protein